MKVMKKNILHIISVSILILTLSGSLLAQSTIRGFVKSGPEGTPVEAAITIGGDLNGYSTGGSYAIGVSSGTHTLAAVYNGNTISKTLTFAPGNNWMNFWFDPPSLPSDFDGNYYHTVNIGTQVWMVENLLVTHFNDGSNITNIIDSAAWFGLTTPAYCWYKNDFTTFKDTYGALYNWFAVSNENLCPIGWHVPSPNEWATLVNYVGGNIVAGGILKEVGTTHWLSPNVGATNEVGFTALPAGVRYGTPQIIEFGGIGMFSMWWTSMANATTSAYSEIIVHDNSGFGLNMGNEKNDGISVRCTKINSAPIAVTLAPSAVTSTSATLHGITNARGDTTRVSFEYGSFLGYSDSIVAIQSPAVGITPFR